MDTKQKFKLCGGCNKTVKEDEKLKCASCFQYYDLECANITVHRFYNTMEKKDKESWKCQYCRTRDRKVNNNSILTREASQQPQEERAQSRESPESDQPVALNLSVSSLRSLIREEMKNVVDTTVGDLVKQQMRSLSDKMDKFCASVTTIRAQIESLEAGVEDKMIMIESLKKDNEDLRGNVMQLKHLIRIREQQALFCDIDIVGVPEAKNENTEHVVQALANKLGVTFCGGYIVSAARVGPAPPAQAGARARPVAVRLARRTVRDELLRSARVRRGATTAGMGLPGDPCCFYVNERLTKENRLLLKRVREIGAQLKWKHIWTKDGQILLVKWITLYVIN